MYSTRAQAQAALRQILGEIDSGHHIHPASRRSTVNDWADTWWKTVSKLEPNTQRGYWSTFQGHILPYFGNWPLAEISFTDVEVYIASKQEPQPGIPDGYSAKQIQSMLTVLAGIMECARRSGPDAPRHDNPARGHEMRVPKKRVRKNDMLSMEHVLIYISQVTPWYRPAVWTMILTGVRPAEMCGLLITDVDWEAGAIHIDRTHSPVPGYGSHERQMVEGPVKADGNRTIPIPEWLRDDLVKMLEARGIPRRKDGSFAWVPEGERLFMNKQGRPINRDTFQAKIIRPAIARAIKVAEQSITFPETFHRAYDLRHSSISLLISDGADILEIADRRGHDPAVTLREYEHLQQGAQRGLTNRLDASRQRAEAALDGLLTPFTGR
jgi:integrase